MGSKGLCSTDLFNEVSLIFVHMVSTGEILLQLLQTKVAPILLDANVFNSKQLGNLLDFHCIFTVFDVCSGGLVDFKFGIDCHRK